MLALLPMLLLAAPSPPTLSAWLVFHEEASLATFEREAARFTDVMAEWLTLDVDGTLQVRPLPKPDQVARMRRACRKHGVRIFAMASNYAETGFDSARITKMLAKPESRESHAQAMVDFVRRERIDGIDLDYESLVAADRDRFSDFVERLANKLHRAKKRLSIAVHAKESEPGTWDGAQAQDWERLGRAVDTFRVMTYDYSWAGSKPGPIAPPDWVDRVAAFAVQKVPAAKVELGIPAYGYIWKGSEGRSVTYAQWRDWAGNAGLQRLPSGELTLPRGTSDAQEIGVFADGESQRVKLSLVARHGLRGTAVWRLGSEAPGLWDVLRPRR